MYSLSHLGKHSKNIYDSPYVMQIFNKVPFLKGYNGAKGHPG